MEFNLEEKFNNLQNGNFESTKFLVVDIEFGGFGAMKEIETFVCDKSDIHKKIKGMMFKINRVDKLKNLLND